MNDDVFDRRRTRGVALFATVFVAAAVRADAPAVQFPAGQDSVSVQCERGRGHLFVPVQVNGADVGLFLIDTGATKVLIDDSIVDNLALDPTGTERAAGIGATRDAKTYALDSLSVGGVTVAHAEVLGANLGANRQASLGRVVGMLGIDFLKRMPFRVDLHDASLTLFDPAHPPTPAGDRFDLRLDHGLPMTQVAFDHDVGGWFVLDTGNNAGFVFGDAYARQVAPWLHAHPASLRTTYGAFGPVKSTLLYAPRATLFGVAIDRPSVTFAGDGVHRLGDLSERGLAGIDCLDPSWTLTFDLARRSVWTQRDASNAPAEWDAPDFNCKHADLEGEVPMMAAAALGRVDYLQKFLDGGADLEADDWRARTTIFYAIERRQVAAVKWFIAHDANVKRRAGEGVTPVSLAAEVGSPEIVAALLDAGGYVDSRDAEDRTPLHAAAATGSVELVKLLLARGGDANAASRRHGNPLLAAAAQGDVAIARLLIDAGADVNVAAGEDGRTPLIAATDAGAAELVRLLLARGANRAAKDRAGHTAMDAARNSADAALITALGGAPSTAPTSRP